MREIQALDPTVDPDQAIRTLCAPAAPAVPKAPAALATPAAAQALKLTDVTASWRGPYAAFLQNATLPHTHTRGCTPGWYAVPRWGTQLNCRWLYLGSLRHCSLLSGDRLCVRGGTGLVLRLLGGRQMF